jgi:solute carrier family 25 phosphate transporter 3
MVAYSSPFLRQFPILAVSDKLDAAKPKPAPTGVDLYARFAVAGAVCCSVTHGGLTPVDVVKTRIQLEPEVYNRVRNTFQENHWFLPLPG